MRTMFALLLLLLGAAAQADDGLLADRGYLGLGAFGYTSDTELRIDGVTGEAGSVVNWERELGLGDKDSFRIDAFWRPSPRHKLRFMYFENDRGGSKTLERALKIEGELYPFDAVARAENETLVIGLGYEYAFLRRDTYELAVTAGLHLTELLIGVEITGSVNDVPVEVGQESRSRLEAPLPMFGVRGLWRIGETVYLDAYVQYFQLEFGASEGSILDYRAAVTWLPLGSFGLGIGYNEFSTKLDVDRNAFNGRIEWDYRGPQVFVVASF